MKKSEVLSKISSDIWSSFYLDKIIPIKNQIKSCKDTLATMERHQSTFDYKPYIVYHREIWDNYSEDLTVISEVSADLLKHQSELWETGKYDSVEFTVITYKLEGIFNRLRTTNVIMYATFLTSFVLNIKRDCFTQFNFSWV